MLMWIRRGLAIALLYGLHFPGIMAWADTPAATSQPVILVVGDSLSAEYGLKRGSGWVSLIEQRLQAEQSAYQIQNTSISGDTSSGGLSRLPAALAKYQPDIVVIELGANDALRGLSLDMTEENLSKMITLSQQAKAQVLLLGMRIPPNYGRQYSEQFHALFSRLSTHHGTQLAPFLMEGIATEPDMFQPDGIHPNEQAQPILADNVWEQLSAMIAPRSDDRNAPAH